MDDRCLIYGRRSRDYNRDRDTQPPQMPEMPPGVKDRFKARLGQIALKWATLAALEIKNAV